MKKLQKFLLATCLISAGLGAATLFSCGDKQPQNGEYEKSYTVEYGSEFSIPSTIKSKYTVKDSKGKTVTVAKGRFTANDLNGYTVKVGGDEIKITVKDTTAPQIYWTKEYIHIEAGKTVDFTDISAYDLCSGVTLVELFLDGGDRETPILGQKFKPTETGKYTVLAKTQDNAGNQAEMPIYVEALENGDEKFRRVTAFSEEYGENQVTKLHGFTAEYVTEERYGMEAGSLKLTANMDLQFTSQSNRFRLKNLFKSDINDTYGLYFRVKNTGAVGKTMQIGRTLTYNLQPGVWTEVYISNTDFKNIADEQKIDNPKNDLTALDFCFFTLENPRLGFSEIYFSDIYYLPVTDTVTFDKRVETLAVNGITDQQSLEEWTFLNRVLTNYTTAQKETSKKDHLLEKIYMDSLTQKYGVTRQELRLTYTDGEFAPYQFISKDKSATMRYDPTMSPTINGKSETGSMRVDTGDSYGASLILQYPLVSADNGTTDVDNTGEDNLFGTVTFSMYFEEMVGKTALVSYNGQIQEVPSGVWTELTFKTKNKSFKNNTLYVYAKTENGYGGWLNDATFWMSSWYATHATTAAEVDGMIAELIAANLPAEGYTENQLYIKTMEAYGDLSAFKRYELTKSEALKGELEEKLLDCYNVEKEDGKVFYLDTQAGAKQVFAYRGKAEYSEEVTHSGDAGNGSLKLSFTGNNWDVGVDLLLPFEAGRSLNKEYKLYAYMDGGKGNKIHFSSWSKGDNEVILVEDQWVEFTVNAGEYVDNNRLFIYANDWVTTLPQGLTVYISAIRVA